MKRKGTHPCWQWKTRFYEAVHKDSSFTAENGMTIYLLEMQETAIIGYSMVACGNGIWLQQTKFYPEPSQEVFWQSASYSKK